MKPILDGYFEDINGNRVPEQTRMQYRRELLSMTISHAHYPLITLTDRLMILKARVMQILLEKQTILSNNNAKSYQELTKRDDKIRYKLLNKERKSIQDTFDRVGQILANQEKETFHIGLCEKI